MKQEYITPLATVEQLRAEEDMLTASKEYSGELGSRLLLNNDNEDDPDSSNVLKDLFNYIGFE